MIASDLRDLLGIPFTDQQLLATAAVFAASASGTAIRVTCVPAAPRTR